MAPCALLPGDISADSRPIVFWEWSTSNCGGGRGGAQQPAQQRSCAAGKTSWPLPWLCLCGRAGQARGAKDNAHLAQRQRRGAVLMAQRAVLIRAGSHRLDGPPSGRGGHDLQVEPGAARLRAGGRASCQVHSLRSGAGCLRSLHVPNHHDPRLAALQSVACPLPSLQPLLCCSPPRAHLRELHRIEVIADQAGGLLGLLIIPLLFGSPLPAGTRGWVGSSAHCQLGGEWAPLRLCSAHAAASDSACLPPACVRHIRVCPALAKSACTLKGSWQGSCQRTC